MTEPPVSVRSGMEQLGAEIARRVVAQPWSIEGGGGLVLNIDPVASVIREQATAVLMDWILGELKLTGPAPDQSERFDTPAFRIAWDLLDQIEPRRIADDTRPLLAGMIAGAVEIAHRAGQRAEPLPNPPERQS